MTMFFDILTLFPAMFDGVFNDSIIKRAVDSGVINISIDSIRNYAEDAYGHVDDYPFGGGPGMLMKPGPVTRAIAAAQQRLEQYAPKVVFLSPQGETLCHERVKSLSREKGLILLCGRYKGIDHRVRERHIDYEISIGDYILSGGEIPAMVLVDAVTRLLPGALGNSESAEQDSFYNGLLSPPQYTRPEVFEGMRVPEILLSGHHRKIREWQQEESEKRTRELRPDLWKHYGVKKNNE
jgi:tRNA (guanine37-N1)-methyltransferase